MPKNVLLIIEGTYPWYRGGVSEWVYQYLQHLDGMNFSILQIATDEFQGLDPHEALYPLTPNIRDFTRISPPEFKSISTQALTPWYESIEASIPRSPAPDVIHVTNTGFAGWLGAQISQTMDIPMLLTEHAIYWKEVEMGAHALECGYQIPQREGAKQHTVEVFRELATQTYRSAREIVTVSKVNIPEQKKLGAEKVRYIPNGIPTSWLMEEKDRANEPHIAWVGRCAEMKNPLAFFEYVKAFRSQEISPAFSMLLCDANEADLKEKVLETAQAHPEVTLIWNEPAASYFSHFDVLLITSHNESQPLVMLEALAHKAIPAGYSVGDFDGEYGLAFSSEITIPEQAAKISALWNSPEEFESLAEQIFNKIKNRHTWETIFDQYKTLILGLAEPKELHHLE